MNGLRTVDWTIPNLNPAWAMKVQETGFNTFGNDFKFIPFDIKQFSLSLPDSRIKDENGNIAFVTMPVIDSDVIVYSGTAHPDLAGYRLGFNLANPFENVIFAHPGTQWFNIASSIGMRKFFNKHSPQILDFFASLVSMRLKEGKRVLLVSKKMFKQFCAEKMGLRLKERGFEDIRIATDNFQGVDLHDRRIIPLIHYGIIGINLFQDFDAVYCLNSYYVNEQAVTTILKGVRPLGEEMKIRLQTSGSPLRRSVSLETSADNPDEMNRLVMMALNQQEMDSVLQVVGRVRPYTSPREVITFQCSHHPQIEYTKEFYSLQEARDYFGISRMRDEHKNTTRERVVNARELGLKQRQAVSELGLGLRTVKRYWNS